VTAGIDFGLKVAAELAGEDAAKAIQLGIEYDPSPPFSSGHPRSAELALVERAIERAKQRQADRKAQVEKAAAALTGRM
jgi:cyclohexyl-isocyanide hydratase